MSLNSPALLLNEFAMMWALKDRFPLHYIIFKQTACHIPHEANCEQLFSTAGLLSDPNMDPRYLSIQSRSESRSSRAIETDQAAEAPPWAPPQAHGSPLSLNARSRPRPASVRYSNMRPLHSESSRQGRVSR